MYVAQLINRLDQLSHPEMNDVAHQRLRWTRVLPYTPMRRGCWYGQSVGGLELSFSKKARVGYSVECKCNLCTGTGRRRSLMIYFPLIGLLELERRRRQAATRARAVLGQTSPARARALWHRAVPWPLALAAYGRAHPVVIVVVAAAAAVVVCW